MHIACVYSRWWRFLPQRLTWFPSLIITVAIEGDHLRNTAREREGGTRRLYRCENSQH